MARQICYIENGIVTTCIMDADEVVQLPDCKECGANPFPGKIVPANRELGRQKPSAPFEYEPLDNTEYQEMIHGRENEGYICVRCRKFLMNLAKANQHNPRKKHKFRKRRGKYGKSNH